MGEISNFLNNFLPELLELIPSTVHNIFFWVRSTLSIELVKPQYIIP